MRPGCAATTSSAEGTLARLSQTLDGEDGRDATFCLEAILTKEIIEASGADTAEHFEKVVRSNHGITFREQAEIWLEQMKNRKRKPVAPSTLENWERCLRNWLNPNIGDMPLDSIGNLVLKDVDATMVTDGPGARAIRSYTNAVKMVVASAVNEEGDALYPRKWNHEFIGLPEDNNPKTLPWLEMI